MLEFAVHFSQLKNNFETHTSCLIPRISSHWQTIIFVVDEPIMIVQNNSIIAENTDIFSKLGQGILI